MPTNTSTYYFIVYYTIANEGGKAIGESTFRVPGNITYFIIEVSELAPGLHHQFQVSITLLRGERKIERERSVVTTQSTVIFGRLWLNWYVMLSFTQSLLWLNWYVNAIRFTQSLSVRHVNRDEYYCHTHRSGIFSVTNWPTGSSRNLERKKKKSCC